MTRPTTPLARSLRWLGKVQFTMVLLLGGAAAMIAGTVLESRAGVEVAQAVVYRAWWFDLYLLLIVVNLVVSVLNRVPIQRHQYAFVLTHASIVALMVGAWTSRTFGYEGRVIIAEGAAERRLYLDEAELRWRWPGAQEGSAALGRGAGLAGRTVAAGAFGAPELRIAEHVPHGVYEEDLVAGGEADRAGVRVHLRGNGLSAHTVLIGESRAHRRKDVGPVEVEMLVARDPAFLEQRLGARDSGAAAVELVPVGGDAPVRIELPRQLGQEVDLGGGVVAAVTTYAHRARVEAGGLVDSPGGMINPAVVVEVRRGERAESLKLFSEFPQFNVASGRVADDPLVADAKLTAAALAQKPLVTVLLDAATGQLYVQLSAAQGRGAAHPAALGRSVVVGDLGIDITVHDYLPHARPVARAVSTPPRAAGEPWLRLVARLGDAEADTWLRFGAPRALELGDGRLDVVWQSAVRELPFQLALDEFEIDYHPGSSRPAQYASHLRIVDADGGETPVVVSMNRPLDHMGYRVFQSSYRLGGMGRPDRTVLTVSRDPGVAIVYPSFVLLILGVGWYLVGSGRRARAAAAAARSATAAPAAVAASPASPAAAPRVAVRS